MRDIFDNPAAFAPMFNETAVFSGDRPEGAVLQSLKVCIMADMDADPIGEESLDTDVENINCICREDDWRFVSGLRRGDFLDRKGAAHARYVVQSVKRDAAMGLVVKARSC